MYRLLIVGLCCGVVATSGCSDGKISTVPVSGVVTLDGAPLGDCTVTFLPQAKSKNSLVAGAPSAAKTDPNGRFVLGTNDGRQGAVVATHVVRIRPAEGGDIENPDDPGGSPNTLVLPKNAMDGSLEFTVPEGGTDTADFALSTKG